MNCVNANWILIFLTLFLPLNAQGLYDRNRLKIDFRGNKEKQVKGDRKNRAMQQKSNELPSITSIEDEDDEINVIR